MHRMVLLVVEAQILGVVEVPVIPGYRVPVDQVLQLLLFHNNVVSIYSLGLCSSMQPINL